MANENETEITLAAALKTWLDSVPAHLHDYFFKVAKTKPSMPRQWLTGRRKLSAAKAADIEKASLLVAKQCPGLPILLRGDINETCHVCPFFTDIIDSDNK